MKILSIGCGYIGSVLAEEIVRSVGFDELIICDSEEERIEKTGRELGEKVLPLRGDISDYSTVLETINDADLVVGLSPGRLGFKVMKACVKKRKSLVDLSYMTEDPFVFQKEAVEGGITIIPDCGVAPGLSNILIGKASSQLDEVQDVIVYVGGLPQKPVPPLDYKVTWCVEDLFEEYTRKAKIVKSNKTIEVDALEGLEEVEFEGLGKFEAFFTDGVRTLHHTINARNMWEKTLRYKGHAEKIKLLRDMGLLEKRSLTSVDLSPWVFMRRFWEEKLSFSEDKDFVLMRIQVTGRTEPADFIHSFEMVDHFDEERSVTAMGRTTAYTALAVIKLLIENRIERKGVVPPEILGMDRELSREIECTLRERDIRVKEKVEEVDLPV